MIQERAQVAETDRWNVKALYPSLAEWKKDFTKWQGEEKSPHWPKIGTFRGRLAEGPKVIEELLKYYLELERNLSKLYTYAHLRHDEDVADDAHKQAYIRITALLNDLRQEASWIEPELLEIPQEKLDGYLKSPELAPYRIYLEKIIRFKPHTLSADQEALLAAAGLALDTAERTFGAFNNADLKFPKIADGSGKMQELTHGKYLTYLRSPDRVLRKNAFQTLHTTFMAYENTLCELVNGQVQKHLFSARTRKFASCLEAALFPHKIEPSVYLNLLETVRRNLPVLHKYLALRKKMLKVDELHMYDLHVPLVGSVDLSMAYEEAEKLVIESVLPLGKEYQKDLEKGLEQDHWVDRYENARKRSGAYSSGCYDSMPYILMNYHGNFHDVMTLAHEAGHSMHSLLSWRTQPYQDAHYPIFVAEVASTFHEELMLRHLLEKMSEKEKRAYLINQKIEDIRNTFFRQTMFAAFELKLHQLAEEGTPLTPALVKEEYRKLNVEYFGPEVVVDPETDSEWSRIPHFYYNFYVYQYATGISAAHALVEIVAKEGPQNYLKFLSSGGSKYPLDLLATAGADMRKPHAIESTIRHFSELTDQLASLGV
jgi:oligoendopeptidase F